MGEKDLSKVRSSTQTTSGELDRSVAIAEHLPQLPCEDPVHNSRPADFRYPKKLAQIPNEATVMFRPGPDQEISGYGIQVHGRVSRFTGKTPGSDVAMPAIHFLSQKAFDRLEAAADRFSLHDIDQAHDGFFTKAWYSEEIGAVEVPLPNSHGDQLPSQIILRARDLKEIFASVTHELEHTKGNGEFLAFRAQHDFELRVGLREHPVTNIAIIEYVHKAYPDPSDLVMAQDEFDKYCMSHGCVEELQEYWRRQDVLVDQELLNTNFDELLSLDQQSFSPTSDDDFNEY